MYYSLAELTKVPIFYFFSEISKIPRCSGNEQAISDYLVQFAMKRQLEVIQDEALNVVIKKPATSGYDHAPTIIIQGHMDMVCEKNAGTVHDFNKDPLQLRVDGDMLYATNTTLGADNGVAVAYALALLDAQDLSHPALEVVITTEEETTMAGALAVDPKYFSGKILINIDSEEDHKLLVSGAGGLRTIHTIPIEWQQKSDNTVAYRVSVKGLQGGHSGMEIDQERGNSNKIIGRLLHNLSMEIPYSMQSIQGGLASNAIPRESEAVIAFYKHEMDKLEEKIEKWNCILKNELRNSDPNVFIKLEETEYVQSQCFSEETKHKVITSLMLVPNGIQRMSMEIEGLVESSINLGIVKTAETTVIFESDARSAVKSLKEAIAQRSKLIADSLGCEFMTDSDYPEWPYNPNSKIRTLFEKVYQERNGTDIEVTAVHAGIECCIFIEKIPGLDAISIGPDMYQVHTPDEHVSIPSMLHNWEYFIAVLEAMK